MNKDRVFSGVLSGRKAVFRESFSVKNAFIICLITGGVFIITGILFNSWLLSLALPVIIMTGYFILTNRTETDLPITVIGDSYYYQGFVFTLISLMTSLFYLGNSKQVDMDSMVASFGAALITTIIGLVCRLWVTSFSVQALQRRERLENQIERSLDKFAGQIDELTTQVVSSITKVHSQTENTLFKTLNNYEEINTEVSDKFIQSMNSSVDKVESELNAIAVRLQEIEIEPNLLSKPFKSSINQVLAPLGKYQEKYEKVNSSFAQLSQQIIEEYDSVSSRLTEHVEKLESQLSQTISNQTESYQKNLNNISEGIIASLSDITDLKLETQEILNEKLSVLGHQINVVSKQLESATVPLSNSASNIENLGEHVSHAVNDISASAEDFANQLSKSLIPLEQLTDTNLNIDAVISNIRALESALDNLTNTSNIASDKINSTANATENASSQVADDISNVYRQLAIQVKALREA